MDMEKHREEMEKAHGLTGHPKAELLYRLAYEEGHSAGWGEVGYHYDMMADLLKPDDNMNRGTCERKDG